MMVKFHTLSVAAILAIASSNTIFATFRSNGKTFGDESVSLLEHESTSLSRGPRPTEDQISQLPKNVFFLLDNSIDMSIETGEENRHFLSEFFKLLKKYEGINVSLIRYNSEEPLGSTKALTNGELKKLSDNIPTKMPFDIGVVPTGIGAALKQIKTLYPGHENFLVGNTITELEYAKALGKDIVVIVFTTGHVIDPHLAYDEAFDARRNGVRFYVINRGGKAENYWTQLLGCHYNTCLSYIRAKITRPSLYLDVLVNRVVSKRAKDAVCLEVWTDYKPNTEKSDVRIMTSTLKLYKTLLTGSFGERNIKGLTCDEQLKDMQKRQIFCYSNKCAPTIYSRSYVDLAIQRLNAKDFKEVLDESSYRSRRLQSVEKHNEQQTGSQETLSGSARVETSLESSVPSSYVAELGESDTETYKQLEYIDKNGVTIFDNEPTVVVDTPEYVQKVHEREMKSGEEAIHLPNSGTHHPPHHRKGANGSGKKTTIVVGIICLVVICAVIAGAYLSLSQQESVELTSEEGDFLNDTTGGQPEVLETQQVVDAENKTWL
ncbi:Thrombospondin-Related Anonymous Protein 4 (TRAP4) [Babesia bovis T2Bo]|uniref:VWFA domain-containing protein n=1 Tax=Babesia bovis TaxID=5865 RepID=A7ATI1_BABBO|nr:Thrombospondin-Related Anonymous Protein 4 (TRAP4) [Babesia bovis T2Bo]EDO06242.1 Thrombospondin-Related Anonymous Protein 4 (TRAP4) [Babesia bovis T2Bo]|eukprot:XP_001609810.1 hypothetical protein [Babesia bovis T2Bo]